MPAESKGELKQLRRGLTRVLEMIEDAKEKADELNDRLTSLESEKPPKPKGKSDDPKGGKGEKGDDDEEEEDDDNEWP